MNVTLINSTNLDGIIAAYRECHASQDKSDGGGEKDIALIRRLLFDFNPPHESPIEHCIYTWRIDGVSRSLTHQLVRHRIASFSQRSQRYVSEKQFEYVTPKSILDCVFTFPVIEEIEPYIEFDGTAKEFYDHAMAKIQNVYNALVERGIPKEDARFVLPNACTSSIVVTMNPRSFRNFLKLRTDKKAQWEIRELANLMYESIPDDHKFMYEDIINKTTKAS